MHTGPAREIKRRLHGPLAEGRFPHEFGPPCVPKCPGNDFCSRSRTLIYQNHDGYSSHPAFPIGRIILTGSVTVYLGNDRTAFHKFTGDIYGAVQISTGIITK